MDKPMDRKDYAKPEVICQRDIEAITGVCVNGPDPQDKLSFDPSQPVPCINPMT